MRWDYSVIDPQGSVWEDSLHSRGNLELEEWRHMDTKRNPTDIGLMSGEEWKEKMWLKGPAFLYEPEDQWPMCPTEPVKQGQWTEGVIDHWLYDKT
uniref:Uncharacterized protein n=1 Tax=Ciona savignyi TaxID=51511 RepID=H2Z1H2_CIOSA